MVLLRYDGREKDILREAGYKIHGGQTFKVDEDRAAELLANRGLPVSVVDEPDLHPEALPEPALPAPSPPGDTDELHRLKRPALNDLARQAGVENPEGLPNKNAVIAALADAQADPAQGDTNDEEA